MSFFICSPEEGDSGADGIALRSLAITGRILLDSGTRAARSSYSDYCLVGTRRFNPRLFVDGVRENRISSGVPAKPSALVDTRVIYCGDNLEQLRKLPDGCIDLIYIDPPFNSNRNYEVFWRETKEKRAFEDRHASTLKRTGTSVTGTPRST